MQIPTSEGVKSVASAGVGGAGLGLGIAGTAGWLLNGGLNGLFGGGNQSNDTRTISALESKIAKLESEKYTDSVGTGVYAELNKKYNELVQFITTLDKQHAIFEAVNTERINCLSNRVATLEGLTKVVVPIANICPPPTTTTTGA